MTAPAVNPAAAANQPSPGTAVVSTPVFTTAVDGVVPLLSASVIICAYTEERWNDLGLAIGSVHGQRYPASQLIVVIDHNDDLLARARAAFPDVTIVANAGRSGLSGARNTGVALATGDVVAFLDDDAQADPGWLELLLGPYGDPDVHGVGGAALPGWPASGRPRWFPPEFDWVVGCSYIGLPTTTAEVRNPIGAAMSIRRSAFDQVGGFSDGLGRIGSVPLGCEETEFGIRLRRDVPAAAIVYEPTAVVAHRVTPERATWRYFRRRCYAEGLSKAVVARRVGKESALAAERIYMTRALPRAVARDLRRPARWSRVGTVVLGVAFTAAGYARGSVAGNPS